MREKFVLLKNKRWKKTHIKSTGVIGASLCKFVTEFGEGTTQKRLKDEIPSCIDCRYLMATFNIMSLKELPMIAKLNILSYIEYAHKQEKYHKAKIFNQAV